MSTILLKDQRAGGGVTRDDRSNRHMGRYTLNIASIDETAAGFRDRNCSS